MQQDSNENSIVVKKLVKNYGSFRALDKLNLVVKKGEVHGFLGPNGAGKSTTIRVLLGILRKTGGEATILGGDPWHDAVKLHKRLAYIPGEVNLWPNLTGGEAIDLFARLRGHKIDRQRRKQLLDRFELDPSKKCRTYSKGNRQKVAIISALASDVELYLMDEPSSGLDPLMEAIFQDHVRELRGAGKTVLLSSHILAEAESLCDRVTIIKGGKDVQTGTLAELRHLTRMSIKVETRKPIAGLKELKGVHNIDIKDHHAKFEVDNDAMETMLKHLTKLDVKHLTSTPPSLEKLFLRHYDDQLSETDKKEEKELA